MFPIHLTSQANEAFVNPVDAATPRRLASVQGYYACKRLLVVGLKSSRTNNTGNAWIGTSDTKQEFLLEPGLEREFVADSGQLIDPYDIWVDVTNAGDGVYWYASNVHQDVADPS